MTKSNGREVRRSKKDAKRKATKKAVKDAVGAAIGKMKPDDPAVLTARVQALEDALKRFVEAQAQNHAELHKAFYMTDAHLFVLKMVCIDIVEDKVVKTEDGGVDLGKYYESFNEMQKKRAEAAEEPEEVEEVARDHKPVEFGGAADVTSP